MLAVGQRGGRGVLGRVRDGGRHRRRRRRSGAVRRWRGEASFCARPGWPNGPTARWPAAMRSFTRCTSTCSMRASPSGTGSGCTCGRASDSSRGTASARARSPASSPCISRRAGTSRGRRSISHQAAEIALRQHGYREAADHLTRALDLLEGPAGLAGASAQELRAPRRCSGSALTALKGRAGPEVEQAYARARELCEQVDDTPRSSFRSCSHSAGSTSSGDRRTRRGTWAAPARHGGGDARSRDLPRRAQCAGRRVVLRRRVRDGARAISSGASSSTIRTRTAPPVRPRSASTWIRACPARSTPPGHSGCSGIPRAPSRACRRRRAGPIDRSSIQPGPRVSLRRGLFTCP